MSELVIQSMEFQSVQANHKGIHLENEVPALFNVNADKDMLTVVINNLLSNAIKFTSENGVITVSAWVENGNYMISVNDTGMGMAPELINSFFKRGECESSPGTKNETGTGLGLSIVKEFIEKQGGVLEIESEVGEGSTFRFSLPKQDY